MTEDQGKIIIALLQTQNTYLENFTSFIMLTTFGFIIYELIVGLNR